MDRTTCAWDTLSRSPVFSQPVSRQCRNAFRMQSLLHSNATISDGSDVAVISESDVMADAIELSVLYSVQGTPVCMVI